MVADLFGELQAELVSLLRGLEPEAWERPTAAGAWTVKDVAAHLLDSDVRRLSLQRDNLSLPPPQIGSYGDLVDFLNSLNASWVAAFKRVSPRQLVDMLEMTAPQVVELFKRLDPFAPAFFSVAWAGEERSENWFDIAREYTEKWHHQEQIREAVGARKLTARKWLHPVLDTFLRGLPHRYREVEAGEGAIVAIEITGEAGGVWALRREQGGWRIYWGLDEGSEPAARVRLDQDLAWRVMTKGVGREAAEEQAVIEGDRALGAPALGLIAIMG